MRKLTMLFTTMLLSSTCWAGQCPPEPELDAAIGKADVEGEAQMRALLDQLATAKGMSPEQTSVYLKSVLVREGPRTAQALRMMMASGLANAARTGQCPAITRAKNNVRGVIVAQWQTVNEEIQKDLTVAAGKP